MTSKTRALLCKSKNSEIRAFDFLNSESTCEKTDIPSTYDRKMAARPFDTIHDILCLILAKRDCNAQIWRNGNRGVKWLSKTVGAYHHRSTIGTPMIPVPNFENWIDTRIIIGVGWRG